ncbi:MAG: hypothetical protein ABH956_03630 [Candidatus Nealsonbacteria bacterium]
MVEEIKEILKEYNKDIKREMGVLVENLESKVDLIIERQDIFEGKLDSHTEMIGKMMVDIERIKNDVEIIKGSLRIKIDLEEFENLEKRVKLLESRIEI